MKCTNKAIVSGFLSLILFILSGCRGGYQMPYDIDSNISAFSPESSKDMATLEAFASDLCVTDEDLYAAGVDMSGAQAACLFDVRTGETLYSKNANKQLHPASLTKIMTALLALKYGNLDDILTVSENAEIKESGAQLCGFKAGDRLSLEQALNGLLIYSGNDAGVVIAEYLSGSVEKFSDLMNSEALSLGATNTHFSNPHGLTEEEHLTTAYDLYLIFNEVIKYDKFVEIISTKEYSSSYTDAAGNEKKLEFTSTNRYLNGRSKSPQSLNVIGGKTGSTDAAGACLILLSRNEAGDDHISVILHADDHDLLYLEMTSMLDLAD